MFPAQRQKQKPPEKPAGLLRKQSVSYYLDKSGGLCNQDAKSSSLGWTQYIAVRVEATVGLEYGDFGKETPMFRSTDPVYENQMPRVSAVEGVPVREDIAFTDNKGRDNNRARKRTQKHFAYL